MNETQLNDLYYEFLENSAQASEEVQKTCSNLNTAQDEYICAVQEDTFRNAFLMGYKKGLEEKNI